MNKKKFEDIIAEQGRLIYTAEGDSMFPLIKPRDLLIIEKVNRPLRVNDIPLYKRNSGQYVLHRIVEIRRGKYVLKGDNRTQLERGITDRHIIGVLTAVVRGGKTFPAETPEEFRSRNVDDLIYLVSCAVNGEKPDSGRVDKMDLAELYRLSSRQMLTAAVSFALERVITLPHAFDQAKKKAIRKLALFDVERIAVTHEFEKEGIWYMPLKGILLKDDYPEFAMREMSDNDILVDPARMPDVRRIMERFGYTCDAFDQYYHDAYSKPPTLEFEIHRSLFDKSEEPLLYGYYADIEHKIIRDGCVCRFTDEDFYIYLICHTYKHYVRAGSGLRSLLDIFVFLRAHPNLDSEYLSSEFKRLHIEAFEKNLRSLSEKVFTGEPLNELENRIFEYCVTSGFEGTHAHMEYNRIAHELNHTDSKAAKRRYIRNRIFPPREALKERYPFASKHAALYPLLIIYRPIKGIFSHPRMIFSEYKRVKRFQMKDIFNR